MAGYFQLPIKAPADVDNASSGRYNIFLNSSDSDFAYKKDSAGVVTSLTSGLVNPMTTLGDIIYGGALGVTTRLGVGTNGQVLTLAAGIPSWATPTTGTVTTVSVVSANGFAGTVANATTTPAITLSTSINSPVLAGNGTALIAATTTGIGSTVVLSTSPTFVTDISAPKIISSTASGGLLLCNNNGVTVASFGVGSAGSTNIALIGATTVTGTISGTSSLTLGTASTTVGSIVLQNATNANTLTIQSGVTSASYSLTLPTAQGGANTYLKNDGAGALSWATVATGISIGDTVGNSPVTGSILMAIGGVVTQSISYRAQQATPFSTAFGFESHSSGSFSGVGNTSIGYQAGKAITTAQSNTIIGYQAATALTTSAGIGQNVVIGSGAMNAATTGAYRNVIIGTNAGQSVNDSGCTFIGYNAGNAFTSNNATAIGSGAVAGQVCTTLGQLASAAGFTYSIALGVGATNSASNQLMIAANAGGALGGTSLGITDVCIGNGDASTSAASVTIRPTSGSGTNNAGGSLTLAGGKSTGSAAGGSLVFKTSTTLGSGTTAQTLVTRLTLSGGAVTTDASTATWADALDFVFGSTTGTKIGTATTQKIGFWNATPIVQVTTAVGSATLASPGAGTSIKSDDTFDGYTLQQVVKALRNLGLLA